MNYATGHALNLDEIYMNFPLEKLKLNSKKCKEITGDVHRKELAKDVFKACIGMVIDDVIENNATFELPTGGKKSSIGMKRIEGDEFVKCRQNGKFQDVNFFKSHFSGYQMYLLLQSAGIMREKMIYLDPKHKNRITELTNQRKNYY